jgi:hypothetical protein
MGKDIITIKHRMTEQLLSVPLARYRSLNRGRYRNWKLHGQSHFIAPPVPRFMREPDQPDDLSICSVTPQQTSQQYKGEAARE